LVKKAVQRGRSERKRRISYYEPYGEPLRFTTRRIKRVTFVNAAEIVRAVSCEHKAGGLFDHPARERPR
jgi:hypothetical protein